jgi:hypothetical protein
MTLSSSHDFTVNAQFIHLLPEYRPHFNVSLPPEYGPKFLACCILSEDLPLFNSGEFPHHPLDMTTPMTLNGPTSRYPVALEQLSEEAMQLSHLYLSTEQDTFDSGTCGQRDWNVHEHHHTLKCRFQGKISGASTRKSGMLFFQKSL